MMEPNSIVKKSQEYYWYHCIDLGNGVVTNGDYDLRPLLHNYGFPEDMKGMSVLDVGRASGFFSFEFEKRGATVTATDIESFFDWDICGGEKKRLEWKSQVGDEKAFSIKKIHGAFEFARRMKNSLIKGKFINVYDICPEAFGGKLFDLVFAGSLLPHLRDPVLALERLYSVTRRKLILAPVVMNLDQFEHMPLMSLVASPSSDLRSWWVMNKKCVIEMLRCANFRNVEVVSEFFLQNRRVPRLAPPHVVVHAEA